MSDQLGEALAYWREGILEGQSDNLTKEMLEDARHFDAIMAAARNWHTLTTEPWNGAHRLREALGYLIVEWNCESRGDVIRLLEDEGVMQACVRSVLGVGEFDAALPVTADEEAR